MANGTNAINDYGSMVETYLRKKDSKKKIVIYDILFYDIVYSHRFGPYLLNLYDILPKDHIDMYHPKVIQESCNFKDKIVGLPVYLDYMYLHSNKKLLKKYGKEVPKTWKDLYDTGKYILENEKKLYNNTNIIGYSGMFPENETGTCSILNFIYSSRDTINSTFPEMTSENAIRALEFIKQLKDEFSTESSFKSSSSFKYLELTTDNYLFSNFYYAPLGTNYISLLPGEKEDISGSAIIGYAVGINKHSSEDKRNEVIKAFQYITSKEMQKKFVIEKRITSSIPSIYDDEKVCEKVDCELMKSIQPFGRPTNITDDYDVYTKRFRTKIFEYIYGDTSSVVEALKNAEDLIKIYYISIDTKESYIGLISLIIMITLSIAMFLSTIILFIEKFKPYFNFLSTDFWFLTIIGSIIIISTCYCGIGEKKNFQMSFFSFLGVQPNKCFSSCNFFHCFILF